MGSEAAETTRNINNASGPGTANECTGQWWFKKCCKGDESLEDGRPLEADHDQLRAIIEANPLITTREVAKFGIWGKLERWKSLIGGCLMSWPQIKNIFLMHSLLLFCTTKNHFSTELWHTTKSGFYTTTGNNQLSGWTQKKLQKALPKAKRAPKKRSRSLWCSAAVLIHYSFLNPSPLHLRNTLSKSMRCTENCNAYSPLWSTEKAQFFFTTTPDHALHNQYFKSWTNQATKFCLTCPIHLTAHQSTTTSSSISTAFRRENTSTTSRKQKMLSKSSSNPKVWILCYRNKHIYFLLAKMCRL